MCAYQEGVDVTIISVIGLGERYGVPTPVNAVLLQAFLAKHQLWGVV